MICSHSSPVNEDSHEGSTLETETLDLSTILHAKDVYRELKRNTDDFENRQPVNSNVISTFSQGSDSVGSEKIKARKAFEMGRFRKKLHHSINDRRNEVSYQENNVNKNKFSSNKENVPLENLKLKRNSVNRQQNDDIIEKLSTISENLCLDDQSSESYLDKHTNASLQEFSIFNDFSPSVRAMLTELGLKPSSNSTSAMELKSKVSADCSASGEIPKPLPLQENTILMNKLKKVGSFVPSILTSLNTGGELKCLNYNGINHQIQEDLEKERFRRKHYEHVVEDLQQKVLTIEQELALVSSLNEKKSLTIKELQQTLENLAVAWQKLEGSQMKILKETEIERDNLRAHLEANSMQTTILHKDLEETKGNLSDQKVKLLKEQEQHKEEVKNLKNQQHNLEEELSTIKTSLQREVMFGEDLKKEVLKLQKLLQEEQMSLLQKASDFDNFKHAIQNQLLEEIQKREEKEAKLDETTLKLEASNAEILSLKEQLDIEKREKDAIKTELRRQESEFISGEFKYRTEMACKVKEVQVRAEEQSKHLEETLNRKYQDEISHLLSEHKQWKEEEETRHLKEIQECRNETAKKCEESQEWLKISKTEVLDLRHKIEQIERGRSQMLSQLRSFLQSMWRNTFQLFYGNSNPDSELLQQEYNFEECLPISTAPVLTELNYIPTSTRKYFSPALPLNLTTGFNTTHQCNIEKEGNYNAIMKGKKQVDNMSPSNKHLETSVVSSKPDEKYLTNSENMTWRKEESCYCDYTGQLICRHKNTFLPTDYQMQCCNGKRCSVLPEQLSSVDYKSCDTCYQQMRCNCNKLQTEVSLPSNILYSSTNATDNMIINCNPSQKVKNAVHFSIPYKDSDGYSDYSEEENKPCSDEYQKDSSSKMMGLPYVKKKPEHSPVMICKTSCHQMPAEKLEELSKPVKKELLSVNPVLSIQNDIARNKIEEQTVKDTAQKEPIVLQWKKCSSRKSEYFKDRKTARKELPSNYFIKDVQSIYCPETRYDMDNCSIKTNFKDWELYNKLHPWK